ncbi:MAG TPA: hypothetical protein DCY85_09405 [Firmicutes bacterium]|nr:hypothetical protein [Bacillota bacterium]
MAECLAVIDLLVDGPYLKEQKTALPFRGSGNQRIIKVRDSLQKGIVVSDPRYENGRNLI